MPRFVDNVDAIVNRLGTEHVGIIWGLSQVPWDSEKDRETFLDMITGASGG